MQRSPPGPGCDASAGSDLALQALLESLDLACGVDDRLLAGEERVAVAADVDPELGRVEPTVHSVPQDPQ